MNQSNLPARTVTRDEAHRQFQDLLDQVTRDKVDVTIEEDGEPVAIVTPFDVHQRRAARRRFLGMIAQAQQQADLSAEEADELAREAVAAIRAQKR